MLLTSKNTRQGSLPGNGYGGFITAIKLPSPGSVIMKYYQKILYQKGEQIGSCAYLHDVERLKLPCGQTKRKARFKCSCGVEFNAIIDIVKRGQTKSCGCLVGKNIRLRNNYHGLSDHILFKKWQSMKRRCYIKGTDGYHFYGGRGIKVCDEWLNDVKSYYDYMISLPNAMYDGYTVDRIRNNEGYKPGNVRWATQKQQANNRRIRKDNKSGYAGVWLNPKGRYVSHIGYDGNKITIGRFDSIKEAVTARNNYITKNNLKLFKLQAYHG